MTETVSDQQPLESATRSASRQDTPSFADRFLKGLLASMVAVYGILTALTIFASSRAEGLYYDNVFIAQAQLNDASELAIEAHIEVSRDLNVLEQMQIQELAGAGLEMTEFLYGHLSADAQASLERSGGIDETYIEGMYLSHNVERERSMRSFDLAVAWSERSSTHETLATMLAVGLAFAAWASLIENAGVIRWVFTAIATLILMGSLGFLGLHLVTREPIEEYAAFIDEGELELILAGGSYVHPSGAFEFAIPTSWELVEEDAALALVSDGESFVGGEFSDVGSVYGQDEMEAHAIQFVDALLGDYQPQMDTLDVDSDVAYAGVNFVIDGIDSYADFFFEQRETVIFVFFFATPSDIYEEMLLVRDGVRDTFQVDPDAARTSP